MPTYRLRSAIVTRPNSRSFTAFLISARRGGVRGLSDAKPRLLCNKQGGLSLVGR